MLPSLLLAWMLAGPAEPAPPETPPAYPTPSGPAEPAPPAATPATPTSPATPAAGPATLAPGTPPPGATPPAVPPPADDLTPPANMAGLSGGVAVRLGTVLAPTTGFAFCGSYNRRYVLLSPSLALGVQIDFSFDRFSTSVDVPSSDTSGQVTNVSSTRTTTATSFAALQTLQVQVGSSHVWAGAGGGLSIGFLTTPEVDLRGNSATAYQPFARAVAGTDFALDGQTSVGLRAGYAKMLSTSTVSGAGGARWDVVGDLLDIQAGLFYRFR
jgi:hypothetical protein